MKQVTSLLLFIFLPCLVNAQDKTYPENAWLDDLEAFVEDSVFQNWMGNQTHSLLRHPTKEIHQYYALTEAGMVLEYRDNSSGGYTYHILESITYGTSNGFNTFEPTKNMELASHSQQLPLGLKLGMTLQEIENETGKFPDFYTDSLTSGMSVYRINNVAPFGQFNLKLTFLDDRLQLASYENAHGLGRYGKAVETNSTNFGLSETIGEQIKIDKLIRGAFVRLLVKNVFEAKEPQAIHDKLKNLRTASGSDFNRGGNNEVYLVSWCTNDIDYPDILYNRLVEYLSITLNPRAHFGLYPNLVISDYDTKKLDNYEQVFFHTKDQYTYERNNDSLVFHAYYIEDDKELVFATYFPSEKIEKKPFDFFSIRSCTEENIPEEPQVDDEINVLFNDEELLALIVNNLQKTFRDFPGNHWLSLIGSDVNEVTIPKGLTTSHIKDGDSFKVKGINLSYRSKKNGFTEKGPFGLKRGLKFEEALENFPGMNPLNSNKEDEYLRDISHSITIFDDVKIRFHLYFDKEKLYYAEIEVSEPLSKEWLLLKDKIFPADPR